MHARTLNEFGDRLADPSTAGTAAEDVATLRQHVIDDPIVTFALVALSDYAQQGRFYNLDMLAGSEPFAPSPRDRWNELEKDIVGLNQDLARLIATDGWTLDAQLLLNEQIAESLLRGGDCISGLGLQVCSDIRHSAGLVDLAIHERQRPTVALIGIACVANNPAIATLIVTSLHPRRRRYAG